MLTDLSLYSREEILATIQREKLKRALEGDFSKFLQYGFLKQTKKPFVYNWHHDDITSHLGRVYDGDILNLIMNLPPRYSKTVIILYFVAWSYAKNPKCNYIHLSYSDSLVHLNSDTVKEIIKAPWFQDLWPLQISKTSDSKQEWRIVNGGSFYAVSTGGQITGRGAGSPDREVESDAYDWLKAYDDYLEAIKVEYGEDNLFSGAILIDDPIKPDDANSDTVRKKINNRLNNTIISRKNSPTSTPIIIVMQRLHEDDMTGFCLDGGTSEDWTQLKLSAIQYREDGEEYPLWEAKHTLEQLNKMKKADPLNFSGQYDQEPTPLEGDMFKRDNWVIVESAPVNIYQVRGYDLAASKTNSSPYTASVKIGRFKDGYIITDVTNERLSPDEVERHMIMNAQLDDSNTHIDFPQDPGQAGKFQAHYLTKKLAGHSVESSPESGSKEERARALSSQQAIGNVYLLKADWNKEFINQAASFPTGTFKDMIDAATRAFHSIEGKETATLSDVLLDNKSKKPATVASSLHSLL